MPIADPPPGVGPLDVRPAGPMTRPGRRRPPCCDHDTTGAVQVGCERGARPSADDPAGRRRPSLRLAGAPAERQRMASALQLPGGRCQLLANLHPVTCGPTGTGRCSLVHISPASSPAGPFGTQRSGVQISPTRQDAEGLVTGPLAASWPRCRRRVDRPPSRVHRAPPGRTSRPWPPRQHVGVGVLEQRPLLVGVPRGRPIGPDGLGELAPACIEPPVELLERELCAAHGQGAAVGAP